VIVPINVTLTIESGATVNFNRNAELKVFGNLVLNGGAVLNFNGVSSPHLEGGISVIDNIAYINFNQHSHLELNSIPDIDNLHLTFNDDSWFSLPENLTLNTSSNYQLIFNDNSKSVIDGTLNVISNEGIYFNDNSMMLLMSGVLNVNENSSLNFSGNSILYSNNSMSISEGATLNFRDDSRIVVGGYFVCQGQSTNNVFFNFTNSLVQQFVYSGSNTLIVDNATFNGGELVVSLAGNQPVPENFSITNTTFRGCQKSIILNLSARVPTSTPVISNCSIINCSQVGIELKMVKKISIEHCTIELNPFSGGTKGIILYNDGEINISDCIVTNSSIGINSYIDGESELDESLLAEVNINQCIFETGLGISLNGQDFIFSSVSIIGNHFETEGNGIVINDFSDFELNITDNVMVGNTDGYSEFGISLTNGTEPLILRNNFSNYRTGIIVSNVTQPSILENEISAYELNVEPWSGIVTVSSNGEIRNNTIQHHWHGIELGSSSPNIGANTITDNLRNGIYISNNSHPDLSEQIIGGDSYPLSGYNTIRENGECNFLPSYSELYLTNRSTVNLEKGCNTIADDREDPALQCNYLYLIDGHHVVGKVNAFRNYWGEVNGGNPVGRFGPSLNVNYDGWLTGPCTYSEVGSALLLANSKGVVYDTVYASGETPSELTDIESRYAAANEYYYNNNFPQAKQEYQGIIEDYGDSTESLQAYNCLYSIANLINSSPETFNQLKEFYLQKAGNQSDSVMIGTLMHLSDLCLVSAEEYLSAITNFDLIAQQNQNTDIALYRHIDALTTALLLPQDSTLNKGILGKYSVNSLSDYTNKLSELIKTRGKSGLESEEELLPTEYTLYQNYPNPFNPVTTIKYDLPNASDVSLIIYDILGRKVKELVNTKQQAGRYEVQFDASNLASGVYIYQFIADNPSSSSGQRFISSKKMILLK
jgi:hypothetical protein